MRKFFTALTVLALSFVFIGCSGERSINASSDKTLYRSVAVMKEFLPTSRRVEFEVAFWTLKESAGSPDEFRKVVDGKTASELIALGRRNFDHQKSAGVKSFQPYTSWDAMIADFMKERSYLTENRRDKKEQMNRIHKF